MDLSIVIVNWNTRDLLARCLESVAGAAPALTREVLVVDNASTDGSAALVRERFPWVRLFENPENVGFARANNQGIRESSGRYILLLNPDTELRPGALETLVQFMDQHPRVGAAGPRLLNADGSLQLSCQPKPTLFRETWMLFRLERRWPVGYYVMEKWDSAVPRPVDVVKGACLIMPRDIILQVGLLDEDYFLYAEELDLCERVRRAGYEIYWVPTAVVSHLGEQSTQQMPESSFLFLYASKHLFFRKHYGTAAGAIFRLILLLSTLPRILLGRFARGHRQGAARLYRLLARAIVSGEFERAAWQQSLRAGGSCKEVQA